MGELGHRMAKSKEEWQDEESEVSSETEEEMPFACGYVEDEGMVETRDCQSNRNDCVEQQEKKCEPLGTMLDMIFDVVKNTQGLSPEQILGLTTTCAADALDYWLQMRVIIL